LKINLYCEPKLFIELKHLLEEDLDIILITIYQISTGTSVEEDREIEARDGDPEVIRPLMRPGGGNDHVLVGHARLEENVEVSATALAITQADALHVGDHDLEDVHHLVLQNKKVSFPKRILEQASKVHVLFTA
jgi:hypothetical protein